VIPIRTAIAVLVTLAACQPSVQQLGSDDVRATFTGTTSYGYYGNGKPFVSYLAPDGTIRSRTDGQLGAGQYRIEPSGELCIRYQGAAQQQDICQTVWKGMGKYYSTLSDGRPGVTITALRPGNAENL
jgi:hypothetical protein